MKNFILLGIIWFVTLLFCSDVFSFTEYFLDDVYKDSSVTTAGWARSGMAILPIKGLSKVFTGTRNHYTMDMDVDTANERVYIGGDVTNTQLNIDSAIVVYNVANPYSPSLIGETTPTVGNDWRGGRGLRYYKSNRVFIGTYYCPSGGVQMYDFSTPSQPIRQTGFGQAEIDWFYIHKDLLFTAPRPDMGPVQAWQINPDNAPVLYKSMTIPLTHIYNSIPLCANDTYVFASVVSYVSAGAETFTVFRYSDTSLITQKFGFGGHMKIQGPYIYMSGGLQADTLFVLKGIDDPVNITVTQKKLTNCGGSGKPFMWANYCFVPCNNGIWIVNNDNLDSMQVLYYTDNGFNYRACVVYNNRVYAGRNVGPITVFDIKYENSANAQSKTVIATSLDIAGATLNVDDFIPANTSINYYLSADNGLHWGGPVTRGVRWGFIFTGTSLKWKAELATNDSSITPIIRSVSVDYVYDTDKPKWNGDITLKTHIDRFDTQLYSSVLSWNNASDSSVLIYYIERKAGDADWSQIDTTLTTTYTFTNLSSLTVYKYRIKAIDVVDNEGEWHEVSDEIAPVWTPDFAVRDTEFKMEQDRIKYSIVISWNPATDNTGDFVFYEIHTKKGDEEWLKEYFGNSKSFEKTGLDGGIVNKIRIRVRDVTGNYTEWSEIAVSRMSSQELGESGGKLSLDDYDGNPDNDASIEIPAGALKRNAVFRIFRIPNDEYSIEAVDPATGRIIEPIVFNKPMIIVIPYKKTIIEASNWKEDELGIYYFDKVKWVPIGGIVDKTNTVVKAKVFHFTLFRVGKVRSDNPNEFTVNVNPDMFTPNGDGINDEIRFNLILGNNIIDKEGIMTIYDIDGKIVKVINMQGATSVNWNGEGETGKLSESGMYVYRVSLSGKSATGVFTIAK